jgi:beta-glucanase (GH16 family)
VTSENIGVRQKVRRKRMGKPKVHIVTCLILLVTSIIAAREIPASTEYELVWSDEFNEDGRPDPNNWTYENGFIRNEELQWYQPDNARCENGLLIIEGRRERKKNPNYRPDSDNWKENRKYAEYTSASMTTRRLHSWMYGRFEMRGRIDTRAGLWPAFWSLGVQGWWPSCGEIDIMEYYQGMLLANAAWGTEKRWVPKWDDVRKPVTDFNDLNWSAKFHVWRMDWDEDNIKLYVDDMLMNAVDLKETFNPDGKNPFRQPHFIIVNLAIGGTAGGDPSSTEFPAKFEVDYIRVYKKKNR